MVEGCIYIAMGRGRVTGVMRLKPKSEMTAIDSPLNLGVISFHVLDISGESGTLREKERLRVIPGEQPTR
eukprot:346149-Amorphochlora_amoeboformis.AAC.2